MIRKRLVQYIESKGISKYRFYKEMNLSNGFLDKEGSIRSDICEKISYQYKDISLEWLITGGGDMIKKDEKELERFMNMQSIYSVPLLPVNAQGGPFDDFEAQVKLNDCERIISPVSDVDFAITITGKSMEPDYPSGAKILIKQVDENIFLEWGSVYVLDTINGAVVKRIKPTHKDGIIMCCSINQDFDPFEVELKNVRRFFKVVMVLNLI